MRITTTIGALAADLVRVPWLTVLREAGSSRAATSGALTMRFMDIRGPATRDPDGLQVVLTDALRRLSLAGQGFGELVTSHLRMIVAADRVARNYLISKSVWGSEFRDGARTDGHILACQLIWAATMIRLARNAKYSGETFDRVRAREACWAAQRRFLSMFDDAEAWIDHMSPPKWPADDSSTA